MRLCTGIAQIGARPPTTAAMHAMTLDGLSGGRAVLGLGVGGPQVAEGWYGRPFARPLARTREYVDVVRRTVAREAPVTSEGPHYPLPYDGEGSVGLGKPLKLITHPLRSRIPILLGAEGPRNVALAFEIADGWLPLYFPPSRTTSPTRSVSAGPGSASPNGSPRGRPARSPPSSSAAAIPRSSSSWPSSPPDRPRPLRAGGMMGAEEDAWHTTW